jgi:hypothetical protein
METNIRSISPNASADVDLRVAELEARERAVAAREQLIQALERRLEDSRRRLEERLQQVKDRNAFQPVQFTTVQFRMPTVDDAYFDAGSTIDEDAWWSHQLGKRKPSLAA